MRKVSCEEKNTQLFRLSVPDHFIAYREPIKISLSMLLLSLPLSMHGGRWERGRKEGVHLLLKAQKPSRYHLPRHEEGRSCHSRSSLVLSPPSQSLLKPVLWDCECVPAFSRWYPPACIRPASICAAGSEAGGGRLWENMFTPSLASMANGIVKGACVAEVTACKANGDHTYTYHLDGLEERGNGFTDVMMRWGLWGKMRCYKKYSTCF